MRLPSRRITGSSPSHIVTNTTQSFSGLHMIVSEDRAKLIQSPLTATFLQRIKAAIGVVSAEFSHQHFEHIF